MRLCDMQANIAAITDRLDALDYSTRTRQVQRFRETLPPGPEINC